MMSFKPGDIVLVEIVFVEGKGSKKRPALVISHSSYNNQRDKIIVAAIKSNITRKLIGETKLANWKDAGLLKPSMVTAILQTVHKDIIVKKLGKLNSEDFEKVRKNLNKIIL